MGRTKERQVSQLTLSLDTATPTSPTSPLLHLPLNTPPPSLPPLLPLPPTPQDHFYYQHQRHELPDHNDIQKTIASPRPTRGMFVAVKCLLKGDADRLLSQRREGAILRKLSAPLDHLHASQCKDYPCNRNSGWSSENLPSHMNNINHDHVAAGGGVVALYEVIETEEFLFLVLEYCSIGNYIYTYF